MSEFNLDVAVGALASIEMEPERWNQESWGAYCGEEDPNEVASCGTAMCMAGWICVNAGEQLAWRKNGIPGSWVADYTKSGEYIESRASELLTPGYTDHYFVRREFEGHEAFEDRAGLFDEGNDLDNLYSKVAAYAGCSVEDVHLNVKHEIERRLVELRGAK